MTTLPFDLTGRNILVTGASSGIGRAIAAAAVNAGAFVLLLGRDEERLAETASRCGERCTAFSYDLAADLDDIPKFVRSLVDKHGPLAGIVHAAGIDFLRPLRAIRGKNLVDAFVTNAATGVMLAKGIAMKENHPESGASVVLISSVAGNTGSPGMLCYSMSKGAVESCVRTLGLELVKDKIRVNGIAPAAIRTPMVEKGVYGSLDDDGKRRFDDRHPMGLGEPEDVAGAAVYLLSDASRYVTGTTMFVDGGYSAQ